MPDSYPTFVETVYEFLSSHCELLYMLAMYNGLLQRILHFSLKLVSEVGFEPTPTFVDQNTLARSYYGKDMNLESGALDHSAILTFRFLSSVILL